MNDSIYRHIYSDRQKSLNSIQLSNKMNEFTPSNCSHISIESCSMATEFILQAILIVDENFEPKFSNKTSNARHGEISTMQLVCRMFTGHPAESMQEEIAWAQRVDLSNRVQSTSRLHSNAMNCWLKLIYSAVSSMPQINNSMIICSVSIFYQPRGPCWTVPFNVDNHLLGRK